MLSKTINFKDYNGEDREQTFLFNLTNAEITKMEMSTSGGLVEKINRIAAAKDGAEIIKMFEEILATAYGEKSPDGLHFVKSPELSRAFSQTGAYDVLFMELVTDPEAASVFISGVIPQTNK